MNYIDKIFLALFSGGGREISSKIILCLPGIYVLHARQESHYGVATKRTSKKFDWISVEGSGSAAKCRRKRIKTRRKRIPMIRLPTRRNTNLLFKKWLRVYSRIHVFTD